MLLKDKIELKKKERKGNHLGFNETKSTAPERKQKQQKENKVNGGSRLTPEKIVQSERLIGAVSEPCWRSEKKKKDTARTPESCELYRYRCPTRVEHRYFAKNGVQPSLCRGLILFIISCLFLLLPLR